MTALESEEQELSCREGDDGMQRARKKRGGKTKRAGRTETETDEGEEEEALLGSEG